MNTRDIARAAVMVALAVALSPFFIPVGIAKCYPAQHMINVMAAAMLGSAPAVRLERSVGAGGRVSGPERKIRRTGRVSSRWAISGSGAEWMPAPIAV